MFSVLNHCCGHHLNPYSDKYNQRPLPKSRVVAVALDVLTLVAFRSAIQKGVLSVSAFIGRNIVAFGQTILSISSLAISAALSPAAQTAALIAVIGGVVFFVAVPLVNKMWEASRQANIQQKSRVFSENRRIVREQIQQIVHEANRKFPDCEPGNPEVRNFVLQKINEKEGPLNKFQVDQLVDTINNPKEKITYFFNFTPANLLVTQPNQGWREYILIPESKNPNLNEAIKEILGGFGRNVDYQRVSSQHGTFTAQTTFIEVNGVFFRFKQY